MNMKKIAILALSLCMVAAIAVTGTIAYFTDTEEATNTFTIGNVKITQNEKEADDKTDFVQDQQVKPIVDDSANKYNDPNYIHKRVSVTNDGAYDAYVRSFVAIPVVPVLDEEGEVVEDAWNSEDFNAMNNWLHWNAYDDSDDGDTDSWYWGPKGGKSWPGNGGQWNAFYQNIGGKHYMVYVVTNVDVLKQGETSHPHFRGFFLDKNVNYDEVKEQYYYYPKNDDGTVSTTKVWLGDISELDILVATQAVQADGFVGEEGEQLAWKALDAAFGEAKAGNTPWDDK